MKRCQDTGDLAGLLVGNVAVERAEAGLPHPEGGGHADRHAGGETDEHQQLAHAGNLRQCRQRIFRQRLRTV